MTCCPPTVPPTGAAYKRHEHAGTPPCQQSRDDRNASRRKPGALTPAERARLANKTGNQNARRDTCRAYGHPLDHNNTRRSCTECDRLRTAWRSVWRAYRRVVALADQHGRGELFARAGLTTGEPS